PYYGAFNNSIAYRGFSLNVSLLYRGGHYFRRESISYQSLFANWTGHGDFEKRWQHPGDEKVTTVPSMVYPADANRDNFYQRSEANIDRGDLVRIQSIRLSYLIRPAEIGSSVISGSVFVGANNLG